MLTTDLLTTYFNQAQHYEQYLTSHTKPNELSNWRAFEARVNIAPSHVSTLRSVARRVNILCVSGTWCGDCVQQVPILAKLAAIAPAPAHIAGQSGDRNAPGFDLRFLERDAVKPLAALLRVCGGERVPVCVFMNEDFEFVSFAGDRPLSRYRAIAARQLGPSCPLPGAPVPADEIAATTRDWADEFERVALLLRLSSKLRQRHND